MSLGCVYGKQTLGVSGLPNGESSSEFSLSEELLWRCWANFLFSASAIRAAGSFSNAAPPLLRLFLTGVPPGDLQRKEGKCFVKGQLFYGVTQKKKRGEKLADNKLGHNPSHFRILIFV